MSSETDPGHPNADRGHSNRRPSHAVTAIAILGLLLVVAGAIAIALLVEPTPPVAPPQNYEPNRTAKPKPTAPAPDAHLAAVDRCREPRLPMGDSIQESFVGLTPVSWLTHIPETYVWDQRHPVVVLLHQNYETAKQFLDYSGFRPLAEQHGFVVIAPQAPEINQWEPGHAVDVVQTAILETTASLCIDTERVFVVGHGAGGRTAMLLSCEPWIAGLATNSFRQGQHERFCPMQPPKPHITLTGKRSKREPVQGGPPCDRASLDPVLSLSGVETIWRRRNTCSSAASKDGPCTTWKCDTPFTSCLLAGGHPWPGAPPRPKDVTRRCDGQPPDFPTAQRIWTFFAQL